MRSASIRNILLTCGIFLSVNAIQVHEDNSEEASSPTPMGFQRANVSATSKTPTITLAPSVTPSTVVITTTTYSKDNGTLVQTSKNVVSVSTDSSAISDFDQKRQLYSRHGSYAIGSSETLNKDIELRESKELSLNHGEHMQTNFKPSPEVRITSPKYKSSAETYKESGITSGSYEPPHPYSASVKFQEPTDDKNKWRTSASPPSGRGTFTTHTSSAAYVSKTKLKSEYPKFEAIFKDNQSYNHPDYHKQLFHRHHSDSDGNSGDGGKEKHTENEPEVLPPPTFPTFESQHHNYHHHQNHEHYDEHETPFSPPASGFGAPTFGYPGMDTESDGFVRTSDRPDIHFEHVYDAIKGNEHIRAPPLHGTGPNRHPNLHSKQHIDHHLLWKGVLKVLAAAVPLGLLFSAMKPNVVIVNANSTRPILPPIPVFPIRPGFGPPILFPPPLPPPGIFPQPIPPINPRPASLFAGRLRNEAPSPNFVADLLKDVNVKHIDPGRAPQMSSVCEDRYFCELGRLGSRPQSDKETAEFLQKLLWKIAIEIPGFQNKEPSKAVFDAMAKDDCNKYYCKEFEHFQEVNSYDVKEWRS